MKGGTGLIAAVTAVVVFLCGSIVGLPLLFAAQSAFAACGPDMPEIAVPPAGTTIRPVGRWTAQDQLSNAATIVATGHRLSVPARGWVIAVATAMQESSLRNLGHGDAAGPDSRGLFQQRAPWGPLADRTNPAKAAAMFYTGGQGGQRGLLDVPGWEKMRLTDAAQEVQHSGLGDAYQQWEADAEELVANVLGIPSVHDIGGGDPGAPCGADDLSPIPVGPGGWAAPLENGDVGSGFGRRGSGFHAGVDMFTRHEDVLGKPIYAASTGVVTVVTCDSSSGTCDRAGSSQVSGCGWYVDIRHAGGVVTRYCHMLRRPLVRKGQTVKAGAQIGVVGSSGNSSGPHLHYEVHIKVGQGRSANRTNAIDPVPFHARAGAPLAS